MVFPWNQGFSPIYIFSLFHSVSVLERWTGWGMSDETDQQTYCGGVEHE